MKILLSCYLDQTFSKQNVDTSVYLPISMYSQFTVKEIDMPTFAQQHEVLAANKVHA